MYDPRTKTRGWRRWAGGVALASAIAMACGDDERDATDVVGSCGEIARLCHPYDRGSPIGHACHELGHAGHDEACGPRRAECVAACPPMEAGSSAPLGRDRDASSDHDAAMDAEARDEADDSACGPYCDCLTSACGAENGYPYASKDACLTGCRALSTDERTCFRGFCEAAKTAGDKAHACEHAWGGVGTAECL